MGFWESRRCRTRGAPTFRRTSPAELPAGTDVSVLPLPQCLEGVSEFGQVWPPRCTRRRPLCSGKCWSKERIMSLAAAPLPVSYNGLDSFPRGVVLEKNGNPGCLRVEAGGWGRRAAGEMRERGRKERKGIEHTWGTVDARIIAPLEDDVISSRRPLLPSDAASPRPPEYNVANPRRRRQCPRRLHHPEPRSREPQHCTRGGRGACGGNHRRAERRNRRTQHLSRWCNNSGINRLRVGPGAIYRSATHLLRRAAGCPGVNHG